jgi:hypothetical protein
MKPKGSQQTGEAIDTFLFSFLKHFLKIIFAGHRARLRKVEGIFGGVNRKHPTQVSSGL